MQAHKNAPRSLHLGVGGKQEGRVPAPQQASDQSRAADQTSFCREPDGLQGGAGGGHRGTGKNRAQRSDRETAPERRALLPGNRDGHGTRRDPG